MVMTNKEKQAALRQRKKTEGLKELRGIWVPTDQYVQIKEAISQMLNTRSQP